jgi:hypothetical protein
MKTWMKILAGLIILGAIGAWAGYTFIYNKAHTDFEKADADYSMSAKQLFDEFDSNPKEAGNKYTGKVIEVRGTLTELEETDDLVIAVFAFEEGMFGTEGVRVTLLPNYIEMVKNHPESKSITLKGFCPGYNGTDVIIESGSVVR